MNELVFEADDEDEPLVEEISDDESDVIEER